MRPAEFPTESIIAAGEALRSAGRNVTGFALRRHVGGGNPARLKQVWDEHANGATGAPAAPVSELPIEVADEMAVMVKALSDQVGALVLTLNDKAVRAAQRRVAEVLRSAGEQRTEDERELADASQTVEDLESRLQEALGAVDQAHNHLAEKNSALNALGVELAQWRERLTLTETAAAKAREQHAADLAQMAEAKEAERRRADDLHDELVKVRAQAQAIREQADQATEQAKQGVQAAAAERDKSRQEAAAAREDAAKLAGRMEAMEKQNAELLALIGKSSTPPAKAAKSTAAKTQTGTKSPATQGVNMKRETRK